VLRWGRSPYEQDDGLARERQRVQALGLRCRHLPQGAPVEAIAEAEVLVVTSLQPVGATALDTAPRCRLLLTTTSGYDHLDLDAARQRGVAVGRMPMVRRDAVVEASLCMGLALLRDMPRQQAEARQGRWVRPLLPERAMARLQGLQVGVVGLGVIGRRMAEVLGLLGARMLGCDPTGVPSTVEPVSIEELLSRCRLVSLNLRLERGAPPVLNASALAAARRDLVLVNTARGGVLDLERAWAMLQAGRLGGLGLDVFPQEPFPRMAELAAHPRVLVTPHAAGFHDDLAQAIADELEAALRAWLAGKGIPNRLA